MSSLPDGELKLCGMKEFGGEWESSLTLIPWCIGILCWGCGGLDVVSEIGIGVEVRVECNLEIEYGCGIGGDEQGDVGFSPFDSVNNPNQLLFITSCT